MKDHASLFNTDEEIDEPVKRAHRKVFVTKCYGEPNEQGGMDFLESARSLLRAGTKSTSNYFTTGLVEPNKYTFNSGETNIISRLRIQFSRIRISID
jgi:hypothetical protein